MKRVFPAVSLARGQEVRWSRSQPTRQTRVRRRVRLPGEFPYPSIAGIEEVVAHECPRLIAGLPVPGAGVGIHRFMGGESMQGTRRFEMDPPITKVRRWAARGPRA